MVTERAQALLAHEIFFFLFLRYRVSRASSSGCSPSQLLPDTAQAVSRFVCKKARPFSDELFCIFRASSSGKKGKKLMKRKQTEHRTVDKVLHYPDFRYNMTVFLRGGFAKFVL